MSTAVQEISSGEATLFMVFNEKGDAIGTGYTPDGSVPTGAVRCTEEQAAAWQGSTLENGLIVAGPPIPPAVPTQVTMRQARLALLAAGKLSAVDTAIAALSSPQKEEAQIEWDYSSTVERNSAIVALLGPALELDDEALDALFTAASKL
jgi:hypothetical protein